MLNPQGLSHITWCFTEPSTPTTEDTSPTTENTTARTAVTQTAPSTTVPFDTLGEEDDEVEVLGTTITAAPETAPEEVSADTLPFTGSESGDAVRLALLALVSGVLILAAVAAPTTKEDSGDVGTWTTN